MIIVRGKAAYTEQRTLSGLPALALATPPASATPSWAPPLIPLWPGFAIDTALFGGVALVAAMIRDVLHTRAVARGNLCPACRYRLAGLPAGAPCPECGKPGAGAGAVP